MKLIINEYSKSNNNVIDHLSGQAVVSQFLLWPYICLKAMTPWLEDTRTLK